MTPRRRDPDELTAAALGGDRVSLARLLTLVEQGGPPARRVGAILFSHAGRAHTLGITGPPGAGKSTLTDRLIATIRAEGKEVGILAIDPSSPYSGGAFLGDRVRMQEHALDAGVYVRSMATRGHLGGLALATPEAVRALDAVGFPWVLVETVGVGQVEIEIVGTADTTLVVLNPGAGDSVQAAKAGLLEVADIFVINKADRPGAKELERDLGAMLDLTGLTAGRQGSHEAHGEGWRPPIIRTVASRGEGIDELWSAVADHRQMLVDTGDLARRRERRLTDELRAILLRLLERKAVELADGEAFAEARDAVITRTTDPWAAAGALVANLDLDRLAECPESGQAHLPADPSGGSVADR